MRLIWEGDQFVWSSLALVNREAVRRVAKLPGVELQLHTRHAAVDPTGVPDMAPLVPLLHPLAGPADVHIRHQWPFRADAPAEGRWVVMQPWEYGAIPRDWLLPMRDEIDEIWVYSQYLYNAFVASGVPRDKVAVIAPGVDTTLYTDEGPRFPLPTAKGFVFVFVGGTIPRKGVDLLFKAYVQAFGPDDDVALVVKDFGSNSFYKGQGMADQLAALAGKTDLPEIQVISDDLQPEEIAGLYRSADCLVHPYRGEGFGLTIAEAMATGLPVVVPNYGPCLDFCSADNAYLVPVKIVPMPDKGVGDMETVSHPWWCEVEIEAMAATLRHVFEHRAEAAERGRRGQARIREAFTWDHTAARIQARLDVIAARPAARFSRQVASMEIEGRRGANLLLMPDWQSAGTAWRQVLLTYLQAFAPADDVALILYVPPGEPLEGVEAAVMGVIGEAGFDPEGIADLIVVQEPLARADHGDLILATDAYLPCGEAAEDAHRSAASLFGRPIIDPVSPAGLRHLLDRQPAAEPRPTARA